MIPSRRVLALFALALLPGVAGAQSTDSTDNKAGVLGRLSQHIGTYNLQQVLNDPQVAPRLQAMLGQAGLRALRDRLQVSGPIAFDGTALVLRGIQPHAGGSDEAILAIRPRDGAMEAAILTDGRSVVHIAPRAQAGSVSDDVSKAAAGWARSANTRVQLRPAPAGS